MLEGKKILVFGGTGFVGSRLVEKLVYEEKAKVTVVVNTWCHATWIARLNCDLVQLDWNDSRAVKTLFSDIDIVFHCIGVGGSAEHSLKVNLGSLQQVYKASKEFGVKRLVYLSSVVVHGCELSGELRETTPFQKTGDPYADSKIACEEWLRNQKSDSLEYVIIRPTFVWGPNSTYYTLDLVRQIKEKRVLLVNNGNARSNAVYIDNLIALMCLTATHENAKNEAFFVADQDGVSWFNYYTKYAEMMGLKLDFTNIPARLSRIGERVYRLKASTIRRKIELAQKIEKIASNSKVRLVPLKMKRKYLKFILRLVEKQTPDISDFDRKMMGSVYHVSMKKASQKLNYKQRFSSQEGMLLTEEWLKLCEQI